VPAPTEHHVQRFGEQALEPVQLVDVRADLQDLAGLGLGEQSGHRLHRGVDAQAAHHRREAVPDDLVLHA
jgi:hypothetical protein